MKNINKVRGYEKDNPNWRGGGLKKCLNCGCEFWVKPSHYMRRQCCSRKCANEYCRKTGRLAGKNNPAYGARTIELVCRHCGMNFEKLARLHQDKRFLNNYCSKKCAGIAIGKRPKYGEDNPNYGNGMKIMGEFNPNWKGGTSFEPYCLEWSKDYKEYIKERDNYQCQNSLCQKKSNILYVHHIDYTKKNCSPENLITLCNSCHSRSNYHREWHKLYYIEIMNQKFGSMTGNI